MFERFTDPARQVVALAQDEARLLQDDHIGTEHFLLGLVHDGEGLAAKALETFGVSLEELRDKLQEQKGSVQHAPLSLPQFTPRAKKVLELSVREGLQLGHNYVGTEHILLGLLNEGQGVAVQILQRQGVDLRQVRARVIHLLLSTYADRGEDNLILVRLRTLGRRLGELDGRFDEDNHEARRSLAAVFGAFNALAQILDPQLVLVEDQSQGN